MADFCQDFSYSFSLDFTDSWDSLGKIQNLGGPELFEDKI